MAAPRLYLDENISRVVAHILISRGLDVRRTQDALNDGQSDHYQLEWATDMQRCLVTHNVKDFVGLHSEFIRTNRRHGGIVVVMHDPKPSIVATKILRRLANESDESVKSNLLFA